MLSYILLSNALYYCEIQYTYSSGFFAYSKLSARFTTFRLNGYYDMAQLLYS
jgi:hypothetical protein